MLKATVRTEPVSQPWRRYLRFSVRGLIVLVLVIAAGMGWIVRQARLQREAVAAIIKAGGSAYYESDFNTGSSRDQPSEWKKWLEECIGIDYVDHVVNIDLSSRVNKADWRQAANRLGDLGQLRWLSLMGSSVDDDVLAHLDGMQHLEVLLLQFTGITDAGLAHLGNLTNLESVLISGDRNARGGITDGGLAHLTGLSKLSKLSLHAVQVSDAGLPHLQRLTNLSELDLSGTMVSDRGLAHLKGLTKLSSLRLRGTRVTNAGLVHLKGLTNLSHLDLVRTRVSDGGLAHLRGLTKLKRLVLPYDRVTEGAMKMLNQALPSLTIEESF
jgi:Leucine-rich repeat (LRR) protein